MNECWRSRATYAVAVLVLIATGCQIGPSVMRRGQEQYAEALRQVMDKQLLLNIVRIRYQDMPVFLQVSSISTQFELSESLGISDGYSARLGVSAGMAHTEKPTITYSIPESREFFGRLLAPLATEQVAVLAEIGWDIDMVLHLTVRKMNGLANLLGAPESPWEERSQSRFLEAVHLIPELAR